MYIKMPKLGESVHEGTLDQWFIKEGDTVAEYDPLCEVITDKVTAEVPSTYDGKITKLLVEPGQTIQVGEPICEIEANGNDLDETPTSNEPDHQSKSTKQQDHIQTQVSSTQSSKNNGRYSPIVLKLASQNNVDLSQVTGTGFEGRVTKKDILKWITSSQSQENEPSTQTDTSQTNHPSPQMTRQDSLPIDGVRRQIAQKMKQSVQEIPHAWMAIEVDATEMSKTRNHYKNQFKQQEGYNLTFFAFFIKAVAETLKNHPLLNSTWHENEIIVHSDINISIAVAHDQHLFVPVIHNADEKSIKGIAKEIHLLANKAKNNQLTQKDMQGGTFTVNNTGSFGSVSSMGIINHPQAAILQVESIVKRPVVIDDMIAIRDMVNLCLSIDHRILDGLAAGQFMQEIKQRMESYTLSQTSVY